MIVILWLSLIFKEFIFYGSILTYLWMNSYNVWNFFKIIQVGEKIGAKTKESWHDWIIVEAGQEVHGS